MTRRAPTRPRRTTRPAAAVAALAAALVLVGCGSSSDPGPTMETGPVTVVRPDGSTRVAPAQTGTTKVTPATELPPPTPRTSAQRLAVVLQKRLAAAGIDSRVSRVSGGAGGVDVGDASITVYASEAESRRFYRSEREAIRTVGGDALGRRVGTRNYYYAEDGKLTRRDRTTFARVVRVAEGR